MHALKDKYNTRQLWIASNSRPSKSNLQSDHNDGSLSRWIFIRATVCILCLHKKVWPTYKENGGMGWPWDWPNCIRIETCCWQFRANFCPITTTSDDDGGRTDPAGTPWTAACKWSVIDLHQNAKQQTGFIIAHSYPTLHPFPPAGWLSLLFCFFTAASMYETHAEDGIHGGPSGGREMQSGSHPLTLSVIGGLLLRNSLRASTPAPATMLKDAPRHIVRNGLNGSNQQNQLRPIKGNMRQDSLAVRSRFNSN